MANKRVQVTLYNAPDTCRYLASFTKDIHNVIYEIEKFDNYLIISN